MTDTYVTTGDVSTDYSPPATDMVTVEGLDVTRFPQGSMSANHGLRLPSTVGPYLDDPAAQGGDTTHRLGGGVTRDGLVTPTGLFHSDVKADFGGRDPYTPAYSFDDVDEPIVINEHLNLDAPVTVS